AGGHAVCGGALGAPWLDARATAAVRAAAVYGRAHEPRSEEDASAARPPPAARRGPCTQDGDRVDCPSLVGGFEAAVDRACGRWVAYVADRPRAVLASVAAVSVAFGVFAALTMGVNADPRSLVNPSLPFQVRQRELGESFHALADGILLVVDADSPSAAGRTADALGAKL